MITESTTYHGMYVVYKSSDIKHHTKYCKMCLTHFALKSIYSVDQHQVTKKVMIQITSDTTLVSIFIKLLM